MSLLLKYLSEGGHFNDNELNSIFSYFEYNKFSKATLLEKENAIAGTLYFLLSGFIRIFRNREGEEVTTNIVSANNFITSFSSFVSNSISEENLSCISDCEVLSITKADYEKLTRESSGWGAFCKQVYEKTIVSDLQRTNDLLTLSAEEKYLKLLSEKPEIVRHVPVQYIASYIGIKPESLSRVRKKINS